MCHFDIFGYAWPHLTDRNFARRLKKRDEDREQRRARSKLLTSLVTAEENRIKRRLWTHVKGARPAAVDISLAPTVLFVRLHLLLLPPKLPQVLSETFRGPTEKRPCKKKKNEISSHDRRNDYESNIVYRFFHDRSPRTSWSGGVSPSGRSWADSSRCARYTPWFGSVGDAARGEKSRAKKKNPVKTTRDRTERTYARAWPLLPPPESCRTRNDEKSVSRWVGRVTGKIILSRDGGGERSVGRQSVGHTRIGQNGW